MKPFVLVAVLTCAALPAWAMPVTVDVIGPDDKPLAGAQLSVAEIRLDNSDKPVPRDVAGENGHFAFEFDGKFPAEKTETPERRTYLFVRVMAPGMATETRTLLKAATTVHLQAGRSWGGVVLDADEKPVAGAKVTLNSWSVGAAVMLTPSEGNAADAPERAGFSSYNDAWNRLATTDVAGHWQFDAMPVTARASLALDDARFIKKRVDLNVGAGDAPPLFARAGATLTGVLVAPDGTPIADTRIMAGYGESVADKTGADGRFTLTGVEPGEVMLQSYASFIGNGKDKAAPTYIVPRLQRVKAVAGQTTDIGKWQAETGVAVKAQVVDAGSKEPLEGAQFYFYDGSSPATSDAQGRTELRALPTQWQGQGSTIGQVNKEGYMSAQVARPTLDEGAQTADLGVIELERGTVIKGRVRVEGEDGKPSSLPSLTLESSDGSNSTFLNLWDGSGNFATEAMKAGSYKVSLGFDMEGENKDWEIVSPTTVTVPAPTDAKTDAKDAVKPQPIEIVVKHLVGAKPLLGEVRGRVTDGQGQGIGGATITARLGGSNRSTSSTTLSENDGSFVVARPTYRPDFAATRVDILSVERPGYLWAGTPTIETKDGATTIGGLAMKKSGVLFAGRVLDEAGQAASGAWVGVLEARDYEPVQAKPDGSFELRDVPLDKFTLIAARGLAWTRLQAESDKPGVALKLATPPAPDREALANQALQGNVGYIEMSAYWDILGAARMEELAARSPRVKVSFALELAKRDPQEFLRRAPALLEDDTDGPNETLMAQLYLARAASENPDERALAAAWLDEQKAEKRQINVQSVTRLLQMARVAQALKRPDEAASWLDYAAAIAAQLGNAGNGESLGNAAARLGYEAAMRFAEGFKPSAEFDFWSGASGVLAQSGDFAGARSALARMKELAKTPELVEADKQNEWDNPTRSLERATQSMALALASTDAAGALELLPADGDDWERTRPLLVVADRAITAKNAPVAERALREIFKMQSVSTDAQALAASLAEQLNPALGAELWAEALRRALDAKDARNYGSSPLSVGMWAFYHARLDPARSRILVEREWNWRLPAAVQDKDKEYSSEAQNLTALALGMAAVDPARALEMRETARAQATKEGAQTSDIKLAAAILASDAQRARLGVDSRY